MSFAIRVTKNNRLVGVKRFKGYKAGLAIAGLYASYFAGAAVVIGTLIAIGNEE